jgi:hypothetical protein
MDRITVDLPKELEKQLRLQTIERFGGKKGDLSKAVEEAVKTWITKKELITPPVSFPTPE